MQSNTFKLNRHLPSNSGVPGRGWFPPPSGLTDLKKPWPFRVKNREVGAIVICGPIPITCVSSLKLQLHDAIYRLRFYSNSLIHILSLSNSHNNVASIEKNRGDKSHRVIVVLEITKSKVGE